MVLVPDTDVRGVEVRRLGDAVEVTGRRVAHRQLRDHRPCRVVIRHHLPFGIPAPEEAIGRRNEVAERERAADVRVRFHVALKALHRVQGCDRLNAVALVSFENNLEHVKTREARVDIGHCLVVRRVGPQQRRARVHVAKLPMEPRPRGQQGDRDKDEAGH